MNRSSFRAGRLFALSLATLALLGCGAAPRPVPARHGDPHAAPSLDVLPSAPGDRAVFSEHARQGLVMARGVLKMTIPAPPADRSFATLQQWIDTAVVDWVSRRKEAIDALRYHLLQSSKATRSEQIVGHAVVGLLQEDLALALQALPSPAELDSEPEIAQMYAEIIRFQARPFLSAALVEFRSCANLSVQAYPRVMNWARFCDTRFKRLRSAIQS
ncbi:MAG: hypothetical protein MJD61_10250 [Proteobacteria bacterium]|nr:hypothetical protein [Pseudomonadota bacterium]